MLKWIFFERHCRITTLLYLLGEYSPKDYSLCYSINSVTNYFTFLVDSGVGLRPQDRGPAAKKASRRREPRRHTVANGIDYNMVVNQTSYVGYSA